MDPLSVTASVLTVVGALTATVNAASVFVEESDDLRELTSQIMLLNVVMATFNRLDEKHAMHDIDLDLFKSAKVRLEAVQSTFDAAISSRLKARRLKRIGRSLVKWHRREIKGLTRSVATMKDELNAAMQMTTLATLFALQDQCTGLTQGLTETRGLVHTVVENECNTGLNRADSHRTKQPHTSTDEQDKRFLTEQFFDAASQMSDSISEVISRRLCVASDLDCSLERSRMFFPEQYIIEQPLQYHMRIFTMSESPLDIASRISKYYLLWPKDARHWIRVTVTATTTTPRAQSHLRCPTLMSYKTLPGSVQPQLEKLLQHVETYSSVTHVHICLETNAAGLVGFNLTQSLVHEDLEEAMAMDTFAYIADIEYRGLPQYLESEIITLAREVELFFVLAQSELCLERKLPFAERTDIDPQPVGDFLAQLKLLLTLQGCVGVPRFMGVVLDDSRTQIRSFLLRAPFQGRLWALMVDAQRQGCPIPLQRRLRWFRQFLLITADVHKRGSPVGWCASTLHDVWVNADDDIEFSQFTTRTSNVLNRHGYLAPEIRKFTKPNTLSQKFDISFQIDMFNLGYLLWRLIRYTSPFTGLFCNANGCEVYPRHICTADHVNPIALPFTKMSIDIGDQRDAEDIPGFVKEIINHCRQELPSARLPAITLLDLLPPPLESNSAETSENAKKSFWRPSALQAPQNIFCDECGQDTGCSHHHCNNCQEGDFDLCTTCYEHGIRCKDEMHELLLRKLENGGFVNEISE